MLQFTGIDLGAEPVPDETTICKFRHLMERKNLGDPLFQRVNEYLAENRLAVSRSTIVDATFTPRFGTGGWIRMRIMSSPLAR